MFAVMLGYGMTETTVAAITHPPKHDVVPGSVGFVLPNTEAKVCTQEINAVQ